MSERHFADGELLAAVFHDLRDPIAAVLMQSGALRKLELGGESGERVHKRAEAISRSADRALKLLGDVHDLLRFRQERLVLQRSTTPVSELAVTLQAAVQEVLGPRRTALRIVEKTDTLSCDAPRLIRALYHRATRAALATPNDSEITLTLEKDRGAVTTSGNESEGTSRSEQLGWAIVETFLEAHGGSVQRVGAGATFTL
ncbi:MAG: sensor histidine kinase [Myxococcaceae bacterium]